MNVLICPVAAQMAANSDMISRMDPYVEVRVGAQRHRTAVAKSQGQFPRWNDQLPFVITPQDTIYFRIKDKDFLIDDYLGEVMIPAAQVFASGGMFSQSLPFQSRKNGGVLQVNIYPQGGMGGYVGGGYPMGMSTPVYSSQIGVPYTTGYVGAPYTSQVIGPAYGTTILPAPIRTRYSQTSFATPAYTTSTIGVPTYTTPLVGTSILPAPIVGRTSYTTTTAPVISTAYTTPVIGTTFAAPVATSFVTPTVGIVPRTSYTQTTIQY